MSKYTIRYYFEYMAETCLWSGNDATRDEFGFNINPDDLPLTQRTKDEIRRLSSLWQESLNWDDPSDASPWSQEEFDEFFADAKDLYGRIRADLTKEFDLINVISNFYNPE